MSRKRLLLPGLVVFALALSRVALAQPAADVEALKKDVQAIKEGQQAIQKELAEIKKLVAAGSRPAAAAEKALNAMVSVEGEPFKGDKNAKLTLVEFSEYQCPFCARHVKDTYPTIDKEYIQTGKVKYVFRDMPLESIHKNAFKAAEAAHCASDQNKFWEMHDRLFENNKQLEPAMLSAHATAIGIDAPKFQKCLDDGKYAAAVRKDMSDANRLGISGTPTVLIGMTQTNDPNIKVLKVRRGAQGINAYKAAFDELLAPAAAKQ